MSINIKPVRTRRDLRSFIRLPWAIYQGDPHWVPPLIFDMKNLLNKQRNPFFKHSDAELFLAYNDLGLVGRIAAIVNNNHNKAHQEKTGFFGFFESKNDQQATEALLDKAGSWLKERGMTSLRGPANFSSNDTWGLLIEGFDSSPVIMMPYNPRYYINLLEKSGLRKIKELFAYTFTEDIPIPERFERFAKKTLEDKSIMFRKINLKNFRAEIETVHKIYNDAWQNNWGFVPMNKEEFTHLAKDLKAAVDPDIVYIAEVNGEPAGFSLSLPDYNEILKDLNGRLLPFGIFKLLLNKSKVKGIRVITLGVKQKFQKKRGLAPTFYYETYVRGKKKGYSKAEFSWILEDNTLMNRALEGLGAKLYKKYAIYEKTI